jgi:AraC-like DNA-binding protein
VQLGSTISTSLLWPFARLMGDYQAELAVLGSAGIPVSILADPAVRVPDHVVRDLLQVSLEKTKEPSFGLRAGERVEAGDLGVVDAAARSCHTLGDAFRYCSRYIALLDDGIDARLIDVSDDRVAWSVRPKWHAGLPASNDFVVASAINMATRYLGEPLVPLEVTLMHHTPTDRAEYERVFRSGFRLGQDANAVVFARSTLSRPLALANRDVFVAFDARAKRAAAELADRQSSRARVRELILKGLSEGDVGMDRIAKQLCMSVATLRRRLAGEGTTHRGLVDEVRRDLAVRYLGTRNLTVGEIAYLLGFSNVPALSKAFKRWTSQSPQEYRVRMLGARPSGHDEACVTT